MSLYVPKFDIVEKQNFSSSDSDITVEFQYKNDAFYVVTRNQVTGEISGAAEIILDTSLAIGTLLVYSTNLKDDSGGYLDLNNRSSSATVKLRSGSNKFKKGDMVILKLKEDMPQEYIPENAIRNDATEETLLVREVRDDELIFHFFYDFMPFGNLDLQRMIIIQKSKQDTLVNGRFIEIEADPSQFFATIKWPRFYGIQMEAEWIHQFMVGDTIKLQGGIDLNPFPADFREDFFRGTDSFEIIKATRDQISILSESVNSPLVDCGFLVLLPNGTVNIYLSRDYDSDPFGFYDVISEAPSIDAHRVDYPPNERVNEIVKVGNDRYQATNTDWVLLPQREMYNANDRVCVKLPNFQFYAIVIRTDSGNKFINATLTDVWQYGEIKKYINSTTTTPEPTTNTPSGEEETSVENVDFIMVQKAMRSGSIPFYWSGTNWGANTLPWNRGPRDIGGVNYEHTLKVIRDLEPQYTTPYKYDGKILYRQGNSYFNLILKTPTKKEESGDSSHLMDDWVNFLSLGKGYTIKIENSINFNRGYELPSVDIDIDESHWGQYEDENANVFNRQSLKIRDLPTINLGDESSVEETCKVTVIGGF